MFDSDYHFKFEDLKVYHRAFHFGEHINTLSEKFPKQELYKLSSQFTRAADSISANISEGYSSTNANFNRYLKMAFDSSQECVTWNSKAYHRKYITRAEFESNRKEISEIGRMISGLRKSLR